jgi:hypothetical protein
MLFFCALEHHLDKKLGCGLQLGLQNYVEMVKSNNQMAYCLMLRNPRNPRNPNLKINTFEARGNLP